jgi:hypothetical protein
VLSLGFLECGSSLASLLFVPRRVAAHYRIEDSGLRLTVLAKDAADAKAVARIRGLGFIGLLVQGAHHQPHHLAMAKGEAFGAHGH